MSVGHDIGVMLIPNASKPINQALKNLLSVIIERREFPRNTSTLDTIFSLLPSILEENIFWSGHDGVNPSGFCAK